MLKRDASKSCNKKKKKQKNNKNKTEIKIMLEENCNYVVYKSTGINFSNSLVKLQTTLLIAV